MIDHISIPVNDLLIARSFYSASLAPLGYIEMHNESDCVGFGKNDRIFLWLFEWVGFNSPIHIAFSAADIEEVNRFYESALAHGGKGNGEPGYRKQYRPNYYAAYVFDLDGNNIEAVCRTKGII